MDILPIATQSSTQTIFFQATGVEKALTLVGAGTIAVLALFGLFTILKLAIKNNIHRK